jgi:tetratricopeptide (TPR) repeat protein
LNGGFYLYDILARPLAKPPATIWFAPGTEAIYGEGLVYENRRMPEEALQALLGINKVIPDVGHSWNLVGHAYAVLNDSPNSYKYLARFGFTGMMDSMNLGELGAAAVRVGRLDEAEKILEAAFKHYPNHRNTILINQASLYGQRALNELVARRVDRAEAQIKKGLEVIVLVPENLDDQNAKARRISYANLWGLSGEVALVRGDGAGAMKWFQDALKLGPDAALAPRWRDVVTALSPRMFGQGI